MTCTALSRVRMYIFRSPVFPFCALHVAAIYKVRTHTHTHTHLGCVVAAKRPSYLNPLSFPLLWSAALSSRNLSFFQKKNKHRRQDLLLYIAREQTPTKKRMEIPSSFSPAREWMHTQKEWMVNNKKNKKQKEETEVRKIPQIGVEDMSDPHDRIEC